MFILTIVPIPLSKDSGDKNPSGRLAEIRSKIAVAEQRIRDLESLLTELILNPTGGVEEVTGVTYIDNTGKRTADANIVRQALYSARAYEGELRTAEQFWNQIVQANKEAEKDTHELFKRG